MNYTVIIILIVLLFVIYQLKTNEKKEGFDIVDSINSTFPTCPTGTTNFGMTDCKEYTETTRCSGDFVLGSININGKKEDRCVKSEDDYALCPKGFELDTSSGKCRKTLPSNCPPGTFMTIGNTCRILGSAKKQKICPTGNQMLTSGTTKKCCPDGLQFAKNPNNTTNTIKCCPPNAPYYRKGNNTNLYKCHTNPT